MQRIQISLACAIAFAVGNAWCSGAQAGRLELLLTGAKGGETAESVVNDVLSRNNKAGAVASAILLSEADDIEFLLPERAEGEFALQLDGNPDSTRAQLERYIVVAYPDTADLAAVAATLASTDGVVAVFETTPVDFLEPGPSASTPSSPANQYHLNALHIPQAWTLNGGYGMVGMLETGVEMEHSDFKAFDVAGNYLGGNLLPAYSLDLGPARVYNGTSWIWDYFHIDLNPDEMQPIAADSVVCDADGDGFMTPSYAGHGSHTTGLVGANAGNADATQGVCQHCGIGVMKVIGHYCASASFPQVRAFGVADSAVIARVLTAATDGTAFQVINMSFATFVPAPYVNYCPPLTEPQQPSICLALQHAAEKDIAMVAASGNNLSNLQFPARDPRVIAVGGLNESLAFWDDFTGNSANCPTPFSRQECGSNFSWPDDIAAGAKQELVAPAKNVISTMHHGNDWNFRCGDSVGGPAGDGVGPCTGTSMSAPIVAGVVGILRSTNPLVPGGTPEDVGQPFGIRDVLAQSTDRSVLGQPWHSKLGYGIPHAERAVRRMLGISGSGAVTNRLTPLFRLYGSNATDYAFVTSPQLAVPLMINGAAPYVSSGLLTTGYGAFPQGANSVPRANAYVLTTQGSWGSNFPGTLPMFVIHRKRSSPVGCTPGFPGCNTLNRDWSVAVGVADLEARVAEGYEHRGLQGYVLARCATPTGCTQPLGAEALYRKCKSSEDDCAVFLERDRVAMQAQGYTAVQGAPADGVLGYAFANVDSDGDKLVDGFEWLLGTSPLSGDSDGDTCTDTYEYPPFGIPNGNPMTPWGQPLDC